jgi:chromosome partitioning protein
LLQTIDKMRAELNPSLTILGILPTRLTHTANAREVLERTQQELAGSIHIFEPPIPETVRFREAVAIGKTIFELAPDSPGATAYRALAEEVERRG